MNKYLKSTTYIDSDHPKIKSFSKSLIHDLEDPVEKIKILFLRIRDEFPYIPFGVDIRHEAMKASRQIDRKSGYCVTKALLLSACARAVGVPARVCFFIVRNHLGTGKLEAALKTDLIVFHGSSEVYLNNKWIKLVPAFDLKLCQKLGVSPIEFDGVNDAIFQEFKPSEGQVSSGSYMEYKKDYGSFEDFPYELAVNELKLYYPDAFDETIPIDKRVLFKHW